MNFGVLGNEILGFFVNLLNAGDWWITGYGFGTFQRPDRIVSNSFKYDDPGSLQMIFLESGFLAGGLFVYILVRGARIGLLYDRTKYYSVGIVSWGLFGLSSWDVWPLLLVMLFTLMIFNYHETNGGITEGKLHNRH